MLALLLTEQLINLFSIVRVKIYQVHENNNILAGEDYLNSKPSGLVSTSSPCWLQARPVMLGSAKVVIKGPSVWNAETRTQRMTSASRHAKTCASTALRVCRQHAHDTDMITSAHALRTPQSQSFANSQNLGSYTRHIT